MKNFIKYISVAAIALGVFCSCDDKLNTLPEGGTMTLEQKSAAALSNPTTSAADLSAIYAQMIAAFGGLADYGQERHNDFGYAALCMYTDSDADMAGYNIGYNWFGSDFSSRDNVSTTSGGLQCLQMWNTYYKMIYACNAIIGLVDPENPGGQVVNYCQALAARAFCYLNMAQIYQFNPAVDKANLDKLCVPIVTPDLTPEQLASNPRATVKEVYDLIFKDLDYAVEHLEGFKRANKGFIDQATAYGLRARANLVYGNWKEAAEDAQKCLDLSGAKPLSLQQASVPGFASAEAGNVIWANIVVETNDIVQTGIVNYPSHLSSFFTDGYTGVGAYRMIPSALFNQIPATDVRKGWWLGADLSCAMNLAATPYADWYAEIVAGGDATLGYITTKFGVADDDMSNLNADSDWIIMRAEEMYLIKAEGLARSGGNGQAVLEDFVKTYRNPSYVLSGDIIDAIWLQRRIELWGEGFSFQDYIRLDKPMTRSNSSNWPAAWAFDIPARHGCLLWRIPDVEIQANQGISDSDNNPFVEHPAV